MTRWRDQRAIIARGIALCCIAALPAAFSAWVDPARLIGEGPADQAIAEALIGGHYVTDVSNYNDRSIERRLASVRVIPPEVLIVGSSRSQPVPAGAFPDKCVYNASVANGRFDDILALYALYDTAGRRPHTLVLNLDPWTLATTGREEYWSELFAAHTAMVRHLGDTSPQWPVRLRLIRDALQRVAAPEYFRLAVFSFRNFGRKGIVFKMTDQPQNAERTKAPDGSIVWKPISASATQALAVGYVTQMRTNTAFYNGNDAITRFDLLERFVRYVRAEGVDVILLLAPFHPLVYTEFGRREPNPVSVLELRYRALAARYGARVAGSYDPAAAGITGADMFDESHMRPAAFVTLFHFYSARE